MKLLIVDAFASNPFTGNPAAVCFTEKIQPEDWMQSVAVEMNLSETAFVRPLPGDSFELRWFTPGSEVDLCGHATLATAHAMWSEGVTDMDTIPFETHSGVLTCRRVENGIELNFPATLVEEVEPTEGLLQALGIESPTLVGRSSFDSMVVIESEDKLRSLRPDFRALSDLKVRGVIVTSPSDDPQYDFVSRFFAPGCGIDEDPVTGSAHCCLGPYWGERLGKTELNAWQASARGGAIKLKLDQDRVLLTGTAITMIRGELAQAAAPPNN